ncbi:MAG: ABC transporter permease, partial [Gemmatimonadaceae bacterium]
MSIKSNAPNWRRYLRFWGSNVDADVNDELHFHIEMRIAEYVARGMSPADARRLAEERFGDVHRARVNCVEIQTERARRISVSQILADVRQDIVFATRVLRRQALPSAVAAICIALGIGATTAMFSVANTMLLRPLPYPNGDRLVAVLTSRKGNRTQGNTVSSMPDLVDWRARQHSFVQLAATQFQMLTIASGMPIRANGALVTPNLFSTLGENAEIGRVFQESDADAGAPAVAIVSRGFAERQFGGAAAIVGQRIRIAGARRTIVGVVTDRWAFPNGVDVWLPLRVDPLRESRGSRQYSIVGELRPGVTAEAADREMRSIGASLARENVDDAEVLPYVEPFRESFVGSARPTLIAL